jgi:hypothetical protein
MRYDEYFELSEQHGWRARDLDWDGLEHDAREGVITPADRAALMATATIEHGVPHYAEVWSLVENLRAHWELWQFVTLWTGEEHRHSFVLKKACDVVGDKVELGVDLDVVSGFAFAEQQKASCPEDCLRTVPGMVTYATIQEAATHRFYTMAAKRTESVALRRLFNEIAGDEMRHHVFYREALKEGFERTDDKAAYIDRIIEATSAFAMPHKIYQLHVDFFDGGEWPIGPEILPVLARSFSFDGELLRRLAASRAPQPAAPVA